jgi:hypothetical protein
LKKIQENNREKNNSLKRKSRYKRGYPVAILLGLEEDYAILWQVYSHVIKHIVTIKIDDKRSDEKSLYKFHQSIINEIKPIFNMGVRTVITVAPKTSYSSEFFEYIQKHHRYLVSSKSSTRVNFADIEGSANNKVAVTELVKSKQFFDLIDETTSEEASNIINILEKILYSKNETSILYSLKEIENKIYDKKKINESTRAFLILTDKYLAEYRNKGRIHRLIQIANNRKIQTRIVKAETSAGSRITQFGGIIFFFD